MKRYELENNDLMVSKEGREFLSYLIECALPKDTLLYFDFKGVKHKFRGAMGLAPGWLESALTESEQRWVSACMLARANHFGISVKLSMRAEHSGFESLQVSEEERNAFTIYEGDFWGILFAHDPVAFVYRGGRTSEEEEDPVLQKRVGTKIDETLSTPETQLSPCGFMLTNNWSNSQAGSIHSQKYQEHVSVYLKPEKNN